MREVSLLPQKNESVVIYQTWLENAAKIGSEKQVKAIMQIINYGIYGTVPDNSDDLYLDLLLSDWMPLVDAQKERRKGGAPKGNQNAKGNKGGSGRPKKTQPENTTLNVNENGNVNVNSHSTDSVPASGGAGDTSSNECPEWMTEEYDGA